MMRALPPLVVAALAACTGPLEPAQQAPGVVERIVVAEGGLAQRVTVTPAAPAPGDTIVIRSRVTNFGLSAVIVTSTICGVHTQGTLELWDCFIRCAGYSTRGDLAAGDSLVDSRRMVVTSQPGRYTLEVRHLLDPDVWLSLPIDVVQP